MFCDIHQPAMLLQMLSLTLPLPLRRSQTTQQSSSASQPAHSLNKRFKFADHQRFDRPKASTTAWASGVEVQLLHLSSLVVFDRC